MLELTNKDTLKLAISYLERWEEGPYGWNVERIYNSLHPMRRILEHAYLGLKLTNNSKEYLYEIALARGIVAGQGIRFVDKMKEDTND